MSRDIVGSVVRFVAMCAALSLGPGCGFFDGNVDDPEDELDQTEQDLLQYEEVRLSLEQAREQVLPSVADDLSAAGPYLTWLDRSNANTAVLHAVRFPGGEEVVSEVPIGNVETAPYYVISESLAMTARASGGDSIYTVIRLDTGGVLDEIERPRPQAADYDAFRLFGEQAYIVADDEDLAVYEWTPGTDTPTVIGSLGAIGSGLGAFIDLVVVEDMAGVRRLIAVGTGGTYSVDLATMAPTRLPFPVQVHEGALNEHGMAVIDGTELWWLDWGATEVRAIHSEVAQPGYRLSPTFREAHWVGSGTANQDVAIDGTTLHYRSNTGVYGYDVATKTVAPVLLDNRNYDHRGVFVTYTGLNAGDGGLFVVGLESTSGSTGADGPVYRVRL